MHTGLRENVSIRRLSTEVEEGSALLRSLEVIRFLLPYINVYVIRGVLILVLVRVPVLF